MKNSKRMLAVIAASGLALGSLPGVANAQSAELGINLGAAVGSGEFALDLAIGLGSSAADLPSLEDLPTGSDALEGALEGALGSSNGGGNTGSDELGETLEEALGSSNGGDNGGGNGGTTGGGTGSDALKGALGSLTNAVDPDGDNDLNTDLLGTLEGIFSGSAGDDDGDKPAGGDAGAGEGSPLDKLKEFFEGLFSGSADAQGDDDPDTPGALATILGALSSGSKDGDSPLDKLIAGSSELGSSDNNVGNNNNLDIDAVLGSTGGAGLVAGALLGAGSLAAGGIAIGLASSGGVNLPALPAIDVAAVCNLPQEGIDFLKGAGSMEPHECLPQDEN